MRETLDLNLARARSFHRPVNVGRFPDPPDLGEKPLNLFTLPCVQLLEAITDRLFPLNTLQGPSGTGTSFMRVRLVSTSISSSAPRARPRLRERYGWRCGTSVPPARHATGLTSRTWQGGPSGTPDGPCKGFLYSRRVDRGAVTTGSLHDVPRRRMR